MRMERIKSLILIFPLLAFSIFSCNESATRDGEIRTYYADSSLQRIIHYKEGLLYGDEKVYYPSGNLKMKRQWMNDTLIFEQHEYYDTLQAYVHVSEPGDTIISETPKWKSYSFVNEIGEIAYQVDYNRGGKAINYFGNPVVSVFMDSIPNGTKTKYEVFYRVATPPFIEKREFKVFVNKGEEIVDSALLEIDTKYNLSSYSFEPKEAGEYILKAVYEQQGRQNYSSDTTYAKVAIK